MGPTMAKTQGIVLVVDDEPGMRTLARRILEPAGYRVTEAHGAAAALALIDAGAHFDLLIADLEMPQISGESMVRQARKRQPDLKVLYVTAHIDRLLDARPELWEGEAFLDKPYTGAGLLEAVSLLLHGTVRKKPEP